MMITFLLVVAILVLWNISNTVIDIALTLKKIFFLLEKIDKKGTI